MLPPVFWVITSTNMLRNVSGAWQGIALCTQDIVERVCVCRLFCVRTSLWGHVYNGRHDWLRARTTYIVWLQAALTTSGCCPGWLCCTSCKCPRRTASPAVLPVAVRVTHSVLPVHGCAGVACSAAAGGLHHMVLDNPQTRQTRHFHVALLPEVGVFTACLACIETSHLVSWCTKSDLMH